VEKAVEEKGEKRRIERYELAAPARIVLEGAEPTVIDLYTKDISADGGIAVRFDSNYQMEPATK
jgi:hypothetical protein